MLNAPNAPASLKLYLKDCIEFFSYIRNNPNKFTGANSIQLYHLRGFENGCQSKKERDVSFEPQHCSRNYFLPFQFWNIICHFHRPAAFQSLVITHVMTGSATSTEH